MGSGWARAGCTHARGLERAGDRLAALDGAGATDAQQIEYVSCLEKLKGVIAAAHARVTDNLARARTAREAERRLPSAKRGQGLASEIGLARRTSPHRGARDLGLEHRQQVDVELAGKIASLGDRDTAARARAIGYRLDPGSAIRRTRGARSDRYVSLRPAPDTMSYLTGFLPVEQGVACLAALRQAADTARVDGDVRSRGQVMADTRVERLTGQATASEVDVEVHVVMTDSTLLSDDPSPAHVIGFGPIHAALARDLVHRAHRAWLRRLYLSPDSSTLVAMDSRRRAFDGELREFIVLRDQICRTPWKPPAGEPTPCPATGTRC